MLAITGLLSLVLLGGDEPNSNSKPKAAPKANAADPSAEVTVEVRIVDLKGLHWRGPVHPRMKSVGRKGAVSVWTTDRVTADAIQKASQNTIQAPKVTVHDGGTSKILTEDRKFYVADLQRVADGPPGKNTWLAYHPDVDSARDGVATDLTCQTAADGIQVKAVIDESRILAIHTYDLKESVANSDPKKPAKDVNAQVQVPEIATCRVEGDWLVPKDGVLVISLGARSSAYDKGKAAVYERVMLIEPTPRKMVAQKVSHETLVSWVAANRTRKVKTTAPPTPPQPTPVPPPAPMAKPMMPGVFPLLASPTIAPRPHWKMSVRLETKSSLPTTPEGGVMACVPLSVTHMPLALPFTWLGVSVEPIGDSPEPKVALKVATPPSRNLPHGMGVQRAQIAFREPTLTDEAMLPPLPDAFVQQASAEVFPTPQIPAARTTKDVNLTLTHTAVEVDSMAPFWFFERSAEDPDAVLFPAPLPSASAVACPDEEPTSAATSNAVNIAKFKAARAVRKQPATTGSVTPPSTTRHVDDDVTPVQFVPMPIPAATPKTMNGSSLTFSLKGMDGGMESTSEIRLKALEAKPITLRLPMADGTIVEVQARVVKP